MGEPRSSSVAWLRNDEMRAYRELDLELHCLTVTLSQNSQDGRIFSGPGFIKQQKTGELIVVLYAPGEMSSSLVTDEFLDAINAVPGKLVPAAKFYDLLAIDAHGRAWKGRGISLGYSMQEGGTVFQGQVGEIYCESEDETPGENDHLFVEIYKKINMPTNKQLEIIEKIDGNETSYSVRSGILRFALGGALDLSIRKEDDRFSIQCRTKNGELPDNIAPMIIDSLQFMLAVPLEYSILGELRQGKRKFVLRSLEKDEIQYQMMPPIYNSEHKDFCGLLSSYFDYVSAHTIEKHHPISEQVRVVCTTSAGFLQTRSLVLCVAIENLLEYINDDSLNISSDDREWIEKAKKHFEKWGGPANLTNRINGMLSQLYKINAVAKFNHLMGMSIITRDQKDAWQVMRNSLAHGSDMRGKDIQDLLDSYFMVISLYYRIIFHIIDYKGTYTDYSIIGWPVQRIEDEIR